MSGSWEREGGWRDEDLVVPTPRKYKAWKHQYTTDAVLLPCSKNSDLLFKFFKEMDSTWEIKKLKVEILKRLDNGELDFAF